MSPCDDSESDDCVFQATGAISGVRLGEGVTMTDGIEAQILDGVIEIPLANDHESDYAPGLVRAVNNSLEYEEILESFDSYGEFDVSSSTVPTVNYMRSAIAENKLPAAGTADTPIYINKDGEAHLAKGTN